MVDSSANTQISQQVALLKNIFPIPSLFSILPYIVLVLNKQHQIIYSIGRFYEILGIQITDDIYGLQIGEALRCINSTKSKCGTIGQCSACGSFQALLECQQRKRPVSKECHITISNQNTEYSLDLLIHAAPIEEFDGEFFLLLIKDISEENRRRAFERVFFHDLLNTSGAVKGLLEILQESSSIEEVRELAKVAFEGMEDLVEEIVNQKQLIAAENGRLALKTNPFLIAEMMTNLVHYYVNDSNTLCKIQLNIKDENLTVSSDLALVRRIISNMIKNAIEAAEARDLVTIDIFKKNDLVEFRIHNPQFIPKKTQAYLFKRSFSTKGAGRGVGTYSMKLLGEKYLGGQVGFISNPSDGTTFIFRLPIDLKSQDHP